MNAILDIRIRVSVREAQAQLRGIRQEMAALQRQATVTGTKGMGTFIGGIKRGSDHLTRFGKNLQWTGRQLEFSFTLPLLAAGFFLTKWALQNEAAMTRVRKVYGDGSESAGQLKAELDALAISFELLSSRFGVNREEVIKIAEAWAQAGSAGVGLAKNVKNTLEFMIISGMEATAATEALIATQAVYGLSSKEMAAQLAILNQIENQTAVDMQGLIDVMQRAGGAARASGIDIRHLAAFTAALVPATGSAATAGDALKTIISRLFAPTRQAMEALGALGINIEDATWQAANGAQRIEMLAESFKGLTPAQEALVASVLGSRRQFNRLLVLLNDVGNANGYYQKSLNATADAQANAAAYAKELGTFLESNPQRFKILTTTIQNLLTNAILPLLPTIGALLVTLTNMAQAFANLDPGMQKFIIFGLLALSMLGTMARYVGAVSLLFGTFGELISWVAKMLGAKAVAEGAAASAGVAAQTAATTAKVGLFSAETEAAISSSAAIQAAEITASGNSATAWNAAYAAMGAGATVGTSAQVTAAGAAAEANVAAAGVSGGAWAGVAAAIAAPFTAIAAAIGVPVWAVVAVIAAAIAFIVALFNDDFRGAVLDAVQWVVDGLSKLPEMIATIFGNVVRIVGAAIEQVIEWLSYLNPFARHSPSLVDNVTAGMDVVVAQYARVKSISSILRNAAAAQQAFVKASGGMFEAFESQQISKDRQNVADNAPGALPAFDAMVGQMRVAKQALAQLEVAIMRQESVVQSWEYALDAANVRLERQEDILSTYQDQLQEVEAQISATQATLDDLGNTDLPGMRAMSDLIFENEQAQKALRLEILRMGAAGESIEDIKDRLAALNGELEMLRGKRQELWLAGAGSSVLSVYDDQIAALEAQREELTQQGSEFDVLLAKLEELQTQGEILNLEESLQFDGPIREIDQMIDGLNEMPFDQIVSQIKEEQAQLAILENQQQAINNKITAQQAIVDQSMAQRDQIQAQYEKERAILDILKDAYSELDELVGSMEQGISNLVQGLKDATKESSEFADAFAAAAAGDFEIPGGDALIGREGLLADIEAFNEEMQRSLEEALGDMGGLDPFGPLRDAWRSFKTWIGDQWHALQRAWDRILVGMPVLWNAFLTLLKIAWSTFSGWMGTAWDTIKAPFVAFIGWMVEQFNTYLMPIIQGFADIWSTYVYPAIVAFVGLAITAWDTLWGFLKPFFDWIFDIINGYVVPVLTLFATTFAIVGELIKRAGMILWNFLKVVFGWIIENATKFLPIAFNILGAAIAVVWNAIRTVISFAWNNVIKPIFDAIAWTLRNVVGPAFSWFKTNVIDPVWGAITSAIDWGWKNVIEPVFDGIEWALKNVVGPAFTWFRDNVVKPVWDGIETIIKNTWNRIADALETGINFFVSAFNMLASGVNTVASALGLDQRVTLMQNVTIARLAKGGVIPATEVGGGFMTSGARAIVGEGRPGHPEFVIPTDPAYRGRAMDLFYGLGSELGVPGYGLGGILNSVSGALNAVKDEGLRMIWRGVRPGVNAAMDAIPNTLIRDVGFGVRDMVDDFVGLKNGGMIVNRTHGGVPMIVGEGRTNEAVQVLPLRGGMDSTGGRTNNFYGDLVFPNVTDGNDAEEFLKNLEGLAK